jgi:hypothetical protein
VSGYVFAFSSCWSCKRAFTYDPERVPSIPIDPTTNLPSDLGGDAARVVRQPICRACIDLANAQRLVDGREPIVVLPGAYPDEDA